MNNFDKLRELLKKLPGIGEKSADRIIYYIITEARDTGLEISQSIKDTIENIKICSICGAITQQDVCEICNSTKRENGLIMVVEKPRDILIFERSAKFKGKYHVLGGLIDPLLGKMPENLSFDSLIKRIEKENIQEIIIAFSPSTEGETTAMYLFELLKNRDIKVSRIAFGIPFGSDFDYIDMLTIGRSIDNRTKLKY